jgi:hypothetical protein
MKTTKQIIPDSEIEEVHAFANFGDMDKRDVVNEGLIKAFIGYTSGSTQMHIMHEHGLLKGKADRPQKIALTVKGLSYLAAHMRESRNEV